MINMSLEEYVQFAEIIASIAVIISIVYLAAQVKQSAKVNSAASRHSISEFVLQISMFNADHADRIAKIMTDSDLTDGDLTFRWWNHMMVFLHAETYFHHYELGLMPSTHWNGYVKYVTGHLASPGAREFWDDIGGAFSLNFSNWVTGLINNENS